MNKNIKAKKIIVAMSGGVDSSVAAVLLKKDGYEVSGAFMKFWSEKGDKENLCCSSGAQQAARDVAAKLDIPFYVFNFQNEFKKEVVDYFLEEQKCGWTPNPCVACNKKIKFGLMMEKALGMGADFVATGHYARIYSRKIKNQNSKTIYKLLKGKDSEKDQSYFLYTLTQKQLGRVLFPLGDYKKEQVYQMAKKWCLPYRKEESFDLCFVGKDTGSFISKYLELKKGKIMNLAGRALGEHAGLAYYTIGQRKNIPLQRGPWWVVKKDDRKNILYVSNDEKDLYGNEVTVADINWIGGRPLRIPAGVLAKIRYKSEAAEAILQIANSKSLIVKFKQPQRAITPGQSVVFYSKDGEILGGGLIKT
jgi:tRNA-specific 2-thiouridylase